MEFALVSPVLFLLLFGVLQYGLYFNDANVLRQGVREAARAAVVENFTSAGCNGTNPAKVLCLTRARIGDSLTGAPVVKVSAPDGWAKGRLLRVCAALRSQGAVGLLPMPNGGDLRAITQMTIEQDALGAVWADASPPADPTGDAWNWC